MSVAYTFTVMTPTFNHAHTLERAYESLKAQTLHEFEWLIVDDGSTDETEALVRTWQNEADFPIRYIWQENGGQHSTINRAVPEATGQLFIILDSDDEYMPEALERLKYHWDSIPVPEREKFEAVAALVQDSDGKILGSRFPHDPTDSDPLEIRHKYKVSGEKLGFHRMDILRKFSFPIFEGENHLPKSLVWNRIGVKYKTR